MSDLEFKKLLRNYDNQQNIQQNSQQKQMRKSIIQNQSNKRQSIMPSNKRSSSINQIENNKQELRKSSSLEPQVKVQIDEVNQLNLIEKQKPEINFFKQQQQEQQFFKKDFGFLSNKPKEAINNEDLYKKVLDLVQFKNIMVEKEKQRIERKSALNKSLREGNSFSIEIQNNDKKDLVQEINENKENCCPNIKEFSQSMLLDDDSLSNVFKMKEKEWSKRLNSGNDHINKEANFLFKNQQKEQKTINENLQQKQNCMKMQVIEENKENIQNDENLKQDQTNLLILDFKTRTTNLDLDQKQAQINQQKFQIQNIQSQNSIYDDELVNSCCTNLEEIKKTLENQFKNIEGNSQILDRTNNINTQNLDFLVEVCGQQIQENQQEIGENRKQNLNFEKFMNEIKSRKLFENYQIQKEQEQFIFSEENYLKEKLVQINNQVDKEKQFSEDVKNQIKQQISKVQDYLEQDEHSINQIQKNKNEMEIIEQKENLQQEEECEDIEKRIYIVLEDVKQKVQQIKQVLQKAEENEEIESEELSQIKQNYENQFKTYLKDVFGEQFFSVTKTKKTKGRKQTKKRDSSQIEEIQQYSQEQQQEEQQQSVRQTRQSKRIKK